jgi:hypothetical protein
MHAPSSTAKKKPIGCCFRSSVTGSRAATRPFTSSIRDNAAVIDQERARQAGQLEVRTNTEAYLRDGRFDQDQMLDVFAQLAAAKSDFRLSRIICHMDWAADRSHIDDLIEFESRVNHVWSQHEDAVICAYDLAKFGGDAVIDIIRTHPMIVIGGILQQNPFFVPPEDFLRERRSRRTLE